jgi:subfamily B ATP-binding cassette protein MsbA
MKKLFSVLKYCRDYKRSATLSVFFNILYALFSVASLVFIVPFLDLLFQKTSGKLNEIVAAGLPKFSFSASYLQALSNFELSSLIVNYGQAQALVAICVAVLIVTFFKNLCRYLAMFFIATIRNGVVRDIRKKIYSKSLDLPLSYYSEEKKGDLMSRMSTDVIEIEWSVMQSLEMIFREPLSVVILFTSLIFISVKLTVIILVLLPLASLIIGFLGKNLKNASRQTKETLGGLLSVIEETLGSLKVIKGFAAEEQMRSKFNVLNERFFKQSVAVYRRTDLSSPLSEVLVTSILMLILFLGGNMVFNGELSGSLFITYFALASQLVPPIKQITIAYNNLQKGIASEERINKILHADNAIQETAQPKKLAHLQNEIEYKNLSFKYHKSGEGYVLQNIDLKIGKGKTVALVGQSGSGKTTMADMLPRFYDADKGELLIDGINVRDLAVKELRHLIGIVTQESVLFNDTVYNNIAFGIENASPEKVHEAARIANAHEFISTMPQGYDTIIGDRGGKLSGGQKQRLNIARAVLKNPDILILDEATSALDTESEKLVQEALSNLMRNRTSIVIAHRLSTIANADEIIVMSKGEIIERGNHEALLALNGTYRKLCDMQSFK